MKHTRLDGKTYHRSQARCNIADIVPEIRRDAPVRTAPPARMGGKDLRRFPATAAITAEPAALEAPFHPQANDLQGPPAAFSQTGKNCVDFNSLADILTLPAQLAGDLNLGNQ